MNFDFDSRTRRDLGYQLIDVVNGFFGSLPDRPVQRAADARVYPPFSAGIILTRHPDALARTFSVSSPYLQKTASGELPDNLSVSAQWSRRMNSLKLPAVFEAAARKISHPVEAEDTFLVGAGILINNTAVTSASKSGSPS